MTKDEKDNKEFIEKAKKTASDFKKEYEQQAALTDEEIAKITKAPCDTKQDPLTDEEKKEIKEGGDE